MSGVIFPASPNWYCSRISDCNEAGKFVFAAHNKLHAVDFSGGDLGFSPAWDIHVERTCGLSLCQDPELSNLCCTCGDETQVKVWDFDARKLLCEHDGHKEKVTSVCWSPVDKDLILSGDEKGNLVEWRYNQGNIKIYFPEKGQISALTCSPHEVWHVAIGYKSGIVILYDLHKDGSILHRFRGHDEEILSIAWCPIPGEEDPTQENDGDDSDQPPKPDSPGYLLATSSRDRSIRIWSTTSGSAMSMLNLPSNTGQRRERFDDFGRTRAWVTLNWPKQMPGHLLSSSHGGELLIWDVWKKGKQRWQVMNYQGDIRAHWRTIFNISVCRNICFTISLDRQLCVWDLSTQQCIAARPTFGGFVYTLANSPVNPGNVAIGVGDQVIRLWNVSQEANLNKISNFWQGIKSKVTALCWHPTQENILAYGTDDGRVGVYDAFKNKPPIMACTFHKNTVYVVTYGPPCWSSDLTPFKTSHALYSCGDGIINQHNPTRLDTKAININDIIKKTNQIKHCMNRSEISWKQDFSVGAVGNDGGSIEILRAPDLKILCIVHVTRKLVNAVRWHPEFTTESGKNKSKFHSWFAVGSNEFNVHAVDVAKYLDAEDTENPPTVNESTRVLIGHTGRVTCLSWSIHREGLLASASYDGTAQVWNIQTGEPIANYRGHVGYILTVLWHPLQEDTVLSGGVDFTLQQWRPSALTDKVPPPKSQDQSDKPGHSKKKKKRKNKPRTQPVPSIESPQDDTPQEVGIDEDSRKELLDLLDERKAELKSGSVEKVPNGAKVVGEKDLKVDVIDSAELLKERKAKLCDILGVEKEEQQLREAEVKLPKRDARDLKRKKPRTLFPMSNEQDNLGRTRLGEDCVNIAHLVYGSMSGEELEEAGLGRSIHLGTFMDKNSLYRLVNAESQQHLTSAHLESYFILEIWKGNIAEMLKVAEEKNHLSEFLVTMTSYSKHPTFLSTCEAFARQLEKADQHTKATCYYLLCLKVYEAVDLLLRNKLFREAVILARLRLPSQDPKIQEVYITWADQMIRDGFPELAAKCYLALKEPRQAIELLAKRNNSLAFKHASQLAIVCKETDLAEEYTRKLCHLCLQNYDWAPILEVTEGQDKLKELQLVSIVHQKLCQAMKDEGLLEETFHDWEQKDLEKEEKKPQLPEILLNTDTLDPMSPWPLVDVNQQSLLHAALKTWYDQCGLKMEEKAVKELYEKLLNFKPAVGEHTQLSLRQGLLHVSCDISLLILAGLLDDKTLALHHMLEAMVTSYSHKLDSLLQGMCRIVLSLGPEFVGRFYQDVQTMKSAVHYEGSSTNENSITEIGKQEVQQEAITGYYCWCVSKYVLQGLDQGKMLSCIEKQSEEGAGNLIKVNGDDAGPEGDKPKSNGLESEVEGTPDTNGSGEGRSTCSSNSGSKLLNFITGSRIESIFQVLLHKVQSRRIMCTEKLAYIEAAIKLKREQTEDDTFLKDESLNSAEIIVQPPRTPIPSFCIDDVEAAQVREPSPESVEVKITADDTSKDGPENDLKVVYRKSPECATGLAETSPIAQRNGAPMSPPFLGLEGNQLNPFSTPPRIEMASVDVSPGVKADADSVEMEKLRAWAAARKRQSDFALMMFKDSFSYENVPNEWYQLPAGEKYTMEFITMDILVNEKAQVSKQLQEVAYFVKDVPFPNPYLSSKMLLDVCQNLQGKYKKDLKSHIDTITAWIMEHSVTQEQKNWVEPPSES